MDRLEAVVWFNENGIEHPRLGRYRCAMVGRDASGRIRVHMPHPFGTENTPQTDGRA